LKNNDTVLRQISISIIIIIIILFAKPGTDKIVHTSMQQQQGNKAAKTATLGPQIKCTQTQS